MVDVIGLLGLEVPDRVVGQRREVHDRVEALEVPRGDVAQVRAQLRHGGQGIAHHAVGEVAGVKAGDLVAVLDEERCHDRADVPQVPRQQYAHRIRLQPVRPCPRTGGRGSVPLRG